MGEAKIYLIIYGLLISIIVGIWVVSSHFEKEAFNRHSNTKATLADAMFSQLRIVAD